MEYLFYRKLRELKIETPGFSLSHFKIAAATSMPALAEQVQAEALDPILFGKPATQMTGERLSARMQIRGADTLEYALVTVAIKRGRSMLGELPIRTTFPMFDHAIESLDSLQWDSGTTLTVTFKTFGASEHRVFGRRNYDSDGFADVMAGNSADRRLRLYLSVA